MTERAGSNATQLAVRGEQQVAAVPALSAQVGFTDNFAEEYRICEVVAKSNLVPRDLQGKPENVYMVLQASKGLDISFHLALAKTHIIDNKVICAAELLRMLLAKHGHRLKIIEVTDKHAQGELQLRGSDGTYEIVPVEYTIAEAQAAGYANKQNWKNDPKSMLVAALTRRAVYWHCPHVAGGMDVIGDMAPNVAAAEPAARPPVSVSAEVIRDDTTSTAGTDSPTGRAPSSDTTTSPAPAVDPAVDSRAGTDLDDEDEERKAARRVLAQAQQATDVNSLTVIGREAKANDLLQVVLDNGETLQKALMDRLEQIDPTKPKTKTKPKTETRTSR